MIGKPAYALVLAALVPGCSSAPADSSYFPRPGDDWESGLFGKPDVTDRRRGRDRPLQTPCTFWEYNDVRVNRTALATLRVWGRLLPDGLRERIMEPIGASDTWEWHGYHNADVEVI